jgi:hypothetical protein
MKLGSWRNNEWMDEERLRAASGARRPNNPRGSQILLGLGWNGWSYNPGWIWFVAIMGFLAFVLISLPGKGEQLLMDAGSGSTNAITQLVAKGADVNRRAGKRQRTALIAAAAAGQRGSVELLLMLGARPDVTDGEGRTALDWALAKGHSNLVELLGKP